MSTYEERRSWVCGCTHSRGMHDNSFSKIPENGETHVPGRKDGKCRANDCGCKAFAPADFKYRSFEKDAIEGLRREVKAPSGATVLFVVDGKELSIMANERDFQDFDHLSDEILPEVKAGEEDQEVVYQWVGGRFQEVA